MRTELLLLILVSSPLALGCGDDGSPGDGGSGTTSTGDSTAAPMTTTSQTTTTQGMTSDGSSSGMADATASSTTEDPSTSSGDPTEGTTEGTSTTGEGDPAYPPCAEGMDPVCPRPYVECYEFSGPEHSVCTQPCMQDDECEAPLTGDATPVCAGQGGDQCLLNCADGATCPDGMECVDIGDMGMFFRCLWPND